MDKKFVLFLVSIISIVFLLSGCNKAAVNKDNENTGGEVVVSNKEEQPPKNTETTAENPKTPADNVSNTTENSSNNTETDKIPEKQEVPVKSKVIVIDPGHGGKSGSEKEPVAPGSDTMKPKNVSGATGVKTKTPEHVITLSVSMKLKELLEKDGYTVVMTRTTSSETIGNVARAEMGNNNKADLVIRVHADSSDNSSAKGASMLIPGNVGYAKEISAISKEYGQTILNTLIEEVKMKNRGLVVRNDLTGFNWSKVPVVLIEMGFLSNPEEDSLLSSENYQQKIAAALEKGIKKALTK